MRTGVYIIPILMHFSPFRNVYLWCMYNYIDLDYIMFLFLCAEVVILQQPMSVCVPPNHEVTLRVQAIGTGALKYQWFDKQQTEVCRFFNIISLIYLKKVDITIVRNKYSNVSNNILLNLFRCQVGRSPSSPSLSRDLENMFAEWATCTLTISSQNG